MPKQDNCWLLTCLALAVPLLVSNGLARETVEIVGRRVDLGKVDIKTASLERKMTGHLIEFTVNNPTSSGLGDLVLEYKIFVRSSFPGARPNAPVTRVIFGKLPIEQLAPRQRIQLASRPFAMNSRRLNSGWVYANAATPRSRDAFIGYAAIIKNRDGNKIAETASARGLLEDWERELQPIPFPYLDDERTSAPPLTVEPGGLGGGGSSSADDSNEDEQE